MAKHYDFNPTARLNDDTEMVSFTIAGKTYDLDPEQAVFIGEQLKYVGGRAKSRYAAKGWKPMPDEETDPTQPDENGFVAQNIDHEIEVEAAAKATGSWAIPSEE